MAATASTTREKMAILQCHHLLMIRVKRFFLDSLDTQSPAESRCDENTMPHNCVNRQSHAGAVAARVEMHAGRSGGKVANRESRFKRKRGQSAIFAEQICRNLYWSFLSCGTICRVKDSRLSEANHHDRDDKE